MTAKKDKEGYARISTREPVRAKAKLMMGRQYLECVVTNISQKGVRLYLRKQVEVGKHALLEIQDFGQFETRVMWSDENETGLQFEHKPKELAEMIRKLIG